MLTKQNLDPNQAYTQSLEQAKFFLQEHPNAKSTRKTFDQFFDFALLQKQSFNRQTFDAYLYLYRCLQSIMEELYEKKPNQVQITEVIITFLEAYPNPYKTRKLFDEMFDLVMLSPSCFNQDTIDKYQRIYRSLQQLIQSIYQNSIAFMDLSVYKFPAPASPQQVLRQFLKHYPKLDPISNTFNEMFDRTLLQEEGLDKDRIKSYQTFYRNLEGLLETLYLNKELLLEHTSMMNNIDPTTKD